MFPESLAFVHPYFVQLLRKLLSCGAGAYRDAQARCSIAADRLYRTSLMRAPASFGLYPEAPHECWHSR